MKFMILYPKFPDNAHFLVSYLCGDEHHRGVSLVLLLEVLSLY